MRGNVSGPRERLKDYSAHNLCGGGKFQAVHLGPRPIRRDALCDPDPPPVEGVYVTRVAEKDMLTHQLGVAVRKDLGRFRFGPPRGVQPVVEAVVPQPTMGRGTQTVVGVAVPVVRSDAPTVLPLPAWRLARL